jgi:hypothetical protein
LEWFTQENGMWGESPSGYGALIELEPGVLGVSYDEYSGAVMVSKLRRYHMQVI